MRQQQSVGRLRAPWHGRRRFSLPGSVAVTGVLLLYVLLSVKRSELKPLWFDELSTLDVASQPTLGQMFRVEPADGNPPLLYFLVRPCLEIWGTSAFALRLPSMLGVALAIVCVYLFVARRFGTAAGLVGAVLLAFSPVSDYGVEARPYGLLLGLTAMLLVWWQHAAETKTERTGCLAALACTLFAVVTTHPLGFLWSGIPLLAGELCRWWRTRNLDKGMLWAVALGFSGLGITLYFGHRTAQVLAAAGTHDRYSSIALPSVGRLAEALREGGLVPTLLLLLPLGLLTLWRRWRATNETRAPTCRNAPVHEWAAVGGLPLTMFVAYLFTRLVTHYFWPRYLLPGFLGWTVLLAMVSGSAGKRWVSLAVLGLGLALSWTDRRLMTLQHGSASGTGPVPALLSEGDPAEPIVIGKPFFFPTIWWYGRPALRARLHYIADPPHAAITSDFIPELALDALHRAGSSMFPPDGLQNFLAQHQTFLLWHRTVPQGCWLEDYLREQHYVFVPLASDASGEETLYEIRAPLPVAANGHR